MGYISKTDEKRWFCVETIADVIHVFGQVDLGNVLDTGEPTLLTYLTEDELEIYVDNKLGPDAYKDAVENGGELFMGKSEKYSPIPPPPLAVTDPPLLPQ